MITSLTTPSPFPLQTTPDSSLLWRTLVRGYLSDTPRKTISDSLKWGDEGLMCLALDDTTATFIGYPEDTKSRTIVMTENHALLLTDGPHPVWPALFDISAISKTLWPLIGTMSNEPSFDITQTQLAPLATISPITDDAQWLTPVMPTPCQKKDRLIDGIAALLSLETSKTGTFGVIARRWTADGSPTPLDAWVILEGMNVETDVLANSINTLFEKEDIALDAQTALSFDQIQRFSKIGLCDPKHIRGSISHKGSKHDYLALVAQTQTLLSQHNLPPVHEWISV